jgi:hypothetical protein
MRDDHVAPEEMERARDAIRARMLERFHRARKDAAWKRAVAKKVTRFRWVCALDTRARRTVVARSRACSRARRPAGQRPASRRRATSRDDGGSGDDGPGEARPDLTTTGARS